jgi:hypothetical protein
VKDKVVASLATSRTDLGKPRLEFGPWMLCLGMSNEKVLPRPSKDDEIRLSPPRLLVPKPVDSYGVF